MALARIWRCSSPVNVKKFVLRKYASETSGSVKKGLVLGVYTGEESNGKDVLLTAAAKQFDRENGGSLMKHIRIAGPGLKKGKVRIFYDLNRCYPIVAVVGLGKQGLGYNQLEEIDEGKEAIRSAAAAASKSLQDLEVSEVIVENLGNAEAAAEGATLGLYCYQQHKNKKKQKVMPQVIAFEGESEGWRNGKIAANAQNVARMLSDMPSNLMTPSVFAKSAKQLLSMYDVELMVHDELWAKERSMGAFLSVARGSKEPPVFLEMSYMCGPKHQKPIIFVGKGVTFDSGGISLKPAANMDEMRADMGGAACVVATMLATAQIKLPVNLIGLIPLCENMPSGCATKPGDVVTAMNGKTIQVDNTDAEGRLILADALCYASTFDPMFTIDIATLTGAMRIALGGVATGVFTNSPDLWQKIQKAGSLTGDRVWRFPLWDAYTKLMTDYPAVDINNVGQGKGGGACTAAAFLKEFAPEGQWMHLDIAGVMGPSPDNTYLQKGMTGRPTRTLIQLVSQFSQNEEE